METSVSVHLVFQELDYLRAEMVQAWKEATAFDGISPNSKFAVFSASNLAAKRFEQAAENIATINRVLLLKTERKTYAAAATGSFDSPRWVR